MAGRRGFELNITEEDKDAFYDQGIEEEIVPAGLLAMISLRHHSAETPQC